MAKHSLKLFYEDRVLVQFFYQTAKDLFMCLTLILPLSLLSQECCLLFMSASNTQVHFRLDFIMEAYIMNPDQTAPLGYLRT